MDFLKNQLARLQQQFGQLSASQKMLSVSLVAIMVMTLLWWGRYAGTAEMEAVLEQDMAPEEVARVTGELRGRGIPYTTQGSRILVPGDRKTEVLGIMIYGNMLPHDAGTTPLLDVMNKSSNPFNSQQQNDLIANEGRQAYLATLIRTFPKVKYAMVALAAPQRRTFENSNAGPSATVQITMKPGEKPDSRLAAAAADVVCGAMGMKRSAVRVIIDGVSRTVPGDGTEDPMDAGGSTWLDRVAAAEAHYTQLLERQFAFCDGVMASVSVQTKDDSSETKETKYDAKGVVSRELENESETQNTSSGGRGNGDVGTNPNTGSNQRMTLADGGDGAGGGGSQSEKNRVKNEVKVPETTRVTRSPAGAALATSATVAFPRSFFIKAYKTETGTDKEPTPALLDPFIKAKLDSFKTMVKACVNLPSEDVVVVRDYPDFIPAAVENPAQATSAVSMVLGNHGKEIALGALALVSLFMMSMLVRKGADVAPAGAATGTGAAGVATAGGNGVAAGATVDAMLAKAGLKKAAAGLALEDAAEVAEGGQMLDGVELDDEAVRDNQVVQQVADLVKDNPDAAANLIKRWMSRT